MRRRRGDTHERILTGALTLFAAQGYERTSLREIAEKLGLTKAAVYYHFAAKEDMLEELGRPFVAGMESLLDSLPGGSADGDDAGRAQVLGAFLDILLAQPDLAALLVNDPGVRDQATAHEARAQLRRLRRWLATDPADRGAELRAACAVAAPVAAAAEFSGVPVPELRRALLEAGLGAMREQVDETRVGELTVLDRSV